MQIAYIISVFSILSLLLMSTAQAAGGSNSSLEDLIRGEGTKYVQLKSFIAPAYVVGKRGTHQRPITVVMEIPDYKKVHNICRQGPRVQAKLIETLYAHPVPINQDQAIDRKIADEDLVPRLVWAVNRAIRQNKAISNVFLIDGTKSLGGGMKSRLPFSSVLGCKEIRDLPADNKAEK